MEKKLIQFTAGKGPAECSKVVAKVLKIFLDEARESSFEVEVLDRVEGPDNGTLNSALVVIHGANLQEFTDSWNGTIQWIGKSPYRKMHKRMNWFIGLNILEFKPIAEDENEITYEAIRSGGPGGQHVNKVSTAIRAKHKATGLTVVASDTRSQIMNKKLAKQRLMDKLLEHHLEAQKHLTKPQWSNHDALNRGNPVRIFRGTDFKSERINKNYKSKRLSLKQQLKRENPDD